MRVTKSFNLIYPCFCVRLRCFLTNIQVRLKWHSVTKVTAIIVMNLHTTKAAGKNKFCSKKLSLNITQLTCGLYYKHMTIINDDSSNIIKWSSKLIDAARGIIYDRHMFIVKATDALLSVTKFTWTSETE